MIGVFILSFSVPMTASAQFGCASGETAHVISSGENLFRISLRYGVTMQSVATRNNIVDYTRIFAGTTLCIPAGGVANPNIPSQGVIVQVIVITATPTGNTSSPTASQTPVSSVNPRSNEANWCYAGQPWGDGRCIVPGNKALQDYWYLAGWCQAQAANGNYPGSPEDCLAFTAMPGSTGGSFDFSSLDVDSDMFFDCEIKYNKSTGTVTSIAKWDEKVKKQNQIIFFTNLPDLGSYSTDVMAGDTTAGTTNKTLEHKTLTRGSAKLNSTATGEDVGPTACTIINT